jgi:putative integral membrane protein (TIGR02587 family)
MKFKQSKRETWSNELNDIIRGACGGFLFGIPLIYTMEVWWIGSLAQPRMILVAIAIAFIVVYSLNRTEGFRRYKKNNRPYEAFIDTVEAMAIGIVCSTFMLVLLRELTFDTLLKESLGKIVYESVPFTLGVALSNQFLAGSRTGDSTGQNNQPKQNQDNLHATLSDIGGTLIGATVIAFNIAPTDEIPMLAAAVSPNWLLTVMATSLLLTYAIVFEAGFANQQKRFRQRGVFQKPLGETIMAYLVSLLAGMFMLWFFQKLTFSDPWTMWLDHTILLGLPASIGGAAGRLAI